MKIMFAVASFWPSKDGVAQITGYLAEGLAKRGHQVYILTGTGNRGMQILPLEENHQGVHIERMRVNTNWPLTLKGRDKNCSSKIYFQNILKFQPDILIIVCAQTWTLDWAVPYLDRISCPKVFYCHGYSALQDQYLINEKLRKRNIVGAYCEYKKKKYFQGLYQIINKFDLAIYLSKVNNGYRYAQEHAVRNGIIIENAIDDIFFSPELHHKIDKEKRCIKYLYVATYNDNKNQDMLLYAYSQAHIERSELIFSGFDENEYLDMLKKHYEEWIPNKEEKKVIFHVNIPREQIYSLYSDADVFVCASKSEQSSIVVNEAAATGMPIISTDVGTTATMEGVTLVHSEIEMAGAIEKMYYDTEFRCECGEKLANWIRLKNCSITDKVTELEQQLMQLYQSR